SGWKQPDQTFSVMLRLRGDIGAADHYDDDRFEETSAYFHEIGDEAGHRHVRIGNMTQEEVAELRALKACPDVRAGGRDPLHDVLELARDVRTEEKCRSTDDDENNEAGYGERERLRRRT